MDVVFIGEVLSSRKVDSEQHMRLRVIRAFKGVEGPEVDVWSDVGTSCGLALREGDRYLIQTGRSDRLTIQVCGSVVHWLEPGAPEPALPPPPREISGVVARDSSPKNPVAGASVWIDLPLGRVTTLTDKLGRFSFNDVPDGTHPIHVDAGPELVAPATTATIDGPTSCARTFVTMRPSGRISGQVVTHDGRPAAGIPLLLLAADAAQGSRGEVVTGDATDRDGRFELAGLSPGAYLLTVSDAVVRLGLPPYPPAWFGGTTRASAARIRVGRGQPAELLTPFVLPQPPDTRTVTITVTCADGTGPRALTAYVTHAGDGHRSYVPDFRKNVLTMPVLVDRAHTLDITAYIPEGQPRPGVRPRASKDLAPLVIPPGRSDERIAVVAPFSNCDDRP